MLYEEKVFGICCEHGLNKKNSAWTEINKKKQLDLFKKNKIHLLQNCQLKKRTDLVFDDMAKELWMTISATHLAVKRNLKKLFGDDSLVLEDTSAEQMDTTTESAKMNK